MSEKAFVLILEGDSARGAAWMEALQRSQLLCNLVPDREAAIDSIHRRPPDVVIAEESLAGRSDRDSVIQLVRRTNPDAGIILVTETDGRHLARSVAEREGLDLDTIPPTIDPDVLRRKVQRAARTALEAREGRLLRTQMAQAFDFSGIIGASDVMQRLIKRANKLARSKTPVLIVGETGTGKELFAQAVHANSPRAGRPFKVINCAAVSETLIESELFGHVKGAFTGATSDRTGLIEAADGGTLFLDEIGDMPLPMQAKLLRTIETGEVMPVGSSEALHFDVRIVAATNRDLGELLREFRFREDLFYRLHAQSPLRIPPLRERREDIPVLIKRFVEQANAENGTAITGVSPEVLRKLVNHNWPGNVRELRNVIERMCIEAEGSTLEVRDLPESLQGTTDIVRVGPLDMAGMTWADVERIHIMNTLRMYGGNRERTAKALGIGVRTLYRKLKDYGLR